MNRMFLIFSLLLIATSLIGCANRGDFVPNACPAEYKFIDWHASSAIYFDVNRQPLNDIDENLEGTYFKKICGSKALSSNTDACSCGTCDTTVKTKHYCLACTTNPCPPH